MVLEIMPIQQLYVNAPVLLGMNSMTLLPGASLQSKPKSRLTTSLLQPVRYSSPTLMMKRTGTPRFTAMSPNEP